MNLNIEAPFNSVSFGNIAYGIVNELFSRKDINLNIFPISNNVDLSAFDKSSQSFKNRLQDSINNSVSNYNKNDPSLKIWHINGSHIRVSDSQYLLTFHELDQLTKSEVNLLNQQKHIFVTSEFSKNVFIDFGVKTPITVVHLGFDNTHFYELNKKYYNDNSIVWSIFGKFEHRKRHEKTIKAWLSKFSGSRENRLHIHVHNPFYKQEDMDSVYKSIFSGKPLPFNVSIYGPQPLNSQMNECFNVCDIVIDMSGGESISLPSMTCCALGRHSIVNYNSGIKEWANQDNSVLIQPCEKIPVYDNIFFKQGSPFNNGNIYDFNTDDFLVGCDTVSNRIRSNSRNTKGLSLQDSFSYKNGVDVILDVINKG